MKKYPLLIEPTFNNAVWGGENLNQYYNHTGTASEAYVLSTIEGKPSLIANGSLVGKDLRTVFADYPYWVNENETKPFPLQIKLIETKHSPSVQVHPSDIFAMSNLNSLGKSEIWYIVDANEGSGVYVGFNKDTDINEVKNRIEDNTLIDIMNFSPVKAGDVVEINAGNVHSLSGGIKAIAIQENCDITYRLYDFGRNDIKRPLEIEKGLKVTNFSKTEHFMVKLPIALDNDNVILRKDFPPYFNFAEVKTEGIALSSDNHLIWLMTTEGDMTIEYIRMGKLLTQIVPNMHAVVIPRGLRCKIKGHTTFIKVEL